MVACLENARVHTVEEAIFGVATAFSVMTQCVLVNPIVCSNHDNGVIGRMGDRRVDGAAAGMTKLVEAPKRL